MAENDNPEIILQQHNVKPTAVRLLVLRELEKIKYAFRLPTSATDSRPSTAQPFSAPSLSLPTLICFTPLSTATGSMNIASVITATLAALMSCIAISTAQGADIPSALPT